MAKKTKSVSPEILAFREAKEILIDCDWSSSPFWLVARDPEEGNRIYCGPNLDYDWIDWTQCNKYLEKAFQAVEYAYNCRRSYYEDDEHRDFYATEFYVEQLLRCAYSFKKAFPYWNVYIYDVFNDKEEKFNIINISLELDCDALINTRRKRSFIGHQLLYKNQD